MTQTAVLKQQLAKKEMGKNGKTRVRLKVEDF